MTDRLQWYSAASLEALNYALMEQATTIHTEYVPYIAYQKHEQNRQGISAKKKEE
jgi:hypothetical protein